MKILIKAGADINEIDTKGYSVLHYACKSDNLETVKEVMKRGPDLNIRNFNNKYPEEVSTDDEIQSYVKKERRKS